MKNNGTHLWKYATSGIFGLMMEDTTLTIIVHSKYVLVSDFCRVPLVWIFCRISGRGVSFGRIAKDKDYVRKRAPVQSVISL
jgi:hypothetical protein